MAVEAPPGNGVSTTLSAAITSTSATTCTLTNAAAFTNAQYHCLITDGTNFEIVEATGLSGSTLTIVRGAENWNGSATSYSFAIGSSITIVTSLQSVMDVAAQVNGRFNIRNFGAKIDGSTDDTAAWTAAISAAAVAGGEVFHPGGTSITTAGVTSSNANVQFRGVGRASILKAGSTNVPLAITGQAFVSNMVFDGGGTAPNAATQSVAVEASYPSLWENIVWQNATSYQYVNTKCEDVDLIGCHTPGAQYAVQIAIPSGAGCILGGQLFGIVDLQYQTYEITGAVTGPLYIENSSALNDTVLNLNGCYIYDGQSWGSTSNCINTGTNLTNINAKGCQFVSVNSSSQRAWVNGNIPGGVTIKLDTCLFTWVAGTAGTCQAVQASGAGCVVIDSPSTNIGSATFAYFNSLSATTVVLATSAAGILSMQGNNTSGGAVASAPTFVSGTAQQPNTTQDIMLYIDVTTAAALTIAIGPTSTPATTLQNAIVGALGLISVRVPAGWYVKLTGTMADLNINAVTC